MRKKEHFEGVSLLPWLTDTPGQEQFPTHLFWFGTLGDVSVQSGHWKLRLSHNTYLFNITQDPLADPPPPPPMVQNFDHQAFVFPLHMNTKPCKSHYFLKHFEFQ